MLLYPEELFESMEFRNGSTPCSILGLGEGVGSTRLGTGGEIAGGAERVESFRIGGDAALNS